MLTELEFNNNRALSSRYNGYDDYLNQMNTTQSDNTQGDNKFNFMDYLPFGDKSISGSIIRGIGEYIPDQDPRQKALNKFYDVNNGTIQSGLMKGYNPVSGGFLNFASRGKFGDPTNYGLQDAYQERIDTINKTLKRKYTNKGISFNKTKLDERRDKLIADMNNESNAMSGGGDGTFGLGTQGQKSYSSPGDSFGTNAITGGPVSNKTGEGRTDYMKGGRAGYFFGGRAGYANGQLVTPSGDGSRPGYRGSDMGTVSTDTRQATNTQGDIDTSGADYGGGNQGGDSSGAEDYSTPEQDRNHDRAMRDYQREKPSTLDNAMNLGSELSYLNNLKNLNVLGIVGNIGVNKFRNYMKNKNLSTEEDKLSYNTNPLPTDNYTSKLVGPALAQMRTLEKAKGMEQFGGPFSIEQGNTLDKLKQMDEEETIYGKPIKFTAANGGRAMFKNGGLAGLL